MKLAQKDVRWYNEKKKKKTENNHNPYDIHTKGEKR